MDTETFTAIGVFVIGLVAAWSKSLTDIARSAIAGKPAPDPMTVLRPTNDDSERKIKALQIQLSDRDKAEQEGKLKTIRDSLGVLTLNLERLDKHTDDRFILLQRAHDDLSGHVHRLSESINDFFEANQRR